MTASELAGSRSGERGRPLPAHRAGPCADCPLAVVFVCRKCERHEKVAGYVGVRTRAVVTTVRCQKVCKGPVAGLLVNGRMEWFGRMDGPKALKAMARMLDPKASSKVPKVLRKRRCKKRSGCRPR